MIIPDKSSRAEDRTVKSFTLWYIVALSAIAVVSVLSQVLIQKYLSNQANDAHVINYAAKLRTYSQSLSKTALLLEKGYEPEVNRKEFVNILKQWQTLHEGLVSGSEFLNLPKSDRAELVHLFDVVHEPYEKMVNASYKIIDELDRGLPVEELDLEPHVQTLLDNEKPYLVTMELIVFDYDRFSQNSINNLKSIEYWLLAFILFMLSLEAAFIFYPLSKRIRSVISDLTESETHAMRLASELQQANESLESSIKELRDTSFALEKATYLVRTDAEGKILYANDKYCHITKYAMHELVGKPLFHNSYGEAESIVYEHIRNKDRRKEVWQGEVYDHASDGTWFWLDVTLMPIIDNKGRVYQYLVVSNDITKRKNAEEELQVLMQEQLHAKSMEQKLKSYSIIAGQEKERQRVATEIHDGIGQMLTSMRMRMEMLVNLRPDVQKEMEPVHHLLRSIIDETRRICSNLLPSVLEDFGLKAAIIELCRNVEEEAGIAIRVEEDLRPQFLHRELEVGVFRILQESMNNIMKHAGADSVVVKLCNDREQLSLCVQDDGKGFAFEEENLYVQDMTKKNNGLRIMKERADMIGGQLRIRSKEGVGTTIELEIPL